MTNPHGGGGDAPDALLATTLMRRGAGTWLGMRGLLALALLLVEQPPVAISAGTALALVVAAAAVGVADAYVRRRERALLGNLGLRTGVLAALLALPALAGEIVVALLVAVAG